MAETTGDKVEGSTEVGSPRPECGKAGEPRSRRLGSGRTAGRGAHSAKSRLVRLRGPAENEGVYFISGAQTLDHTALPGGNTGLAVSSNVRQIPRGFISGKSSF